MKNIHPLSLLLGLILGLAAAGLAPSLPALRAQEDKEAPKEEAEAKAPADAAEKKEALSQEEIDKRLDKILEDQKKVEARLDQIITAVKSTKAMAGR